MTIHINNSYNFKFLLFRQLGDDWSVKPEMLDDIEAFTCLTYGYHRHKSIDTVRGITLRKIGGENDQLTTKCKVDLSYLPPFRGNLIPHIQCMNHRLAIYKRADVRSFWSPKPYYHEHGWERNEVTFWSQCGIVVHCFPLL